MCAVRTIAEMTTAAKTQCLSAQEMVHHFWMKGRRVYVAATRFFSTGGSATKEKRT